VLVTPYGQKVISRNKVPMTKAEVLRFIEFESLLNKMGWQIICPNCTRLFGYGHDGVEGNNDSGDTTFRMRCGCSEHIFDPNERAN
jgi:hypothetical protein